ncbi:hypothetical protein FOL88_03460 [Lactobacillus reuteri]|uniref:hypothetical protein n=1 Tax=Limosilactobacillus reuteri TaxID=1598 RepID=UPI00146D69BD|nr:hypothetical protein [Limosilactobacillus reuteri]NMV54033.1 hypothetical protein [Limosilactobacillus reuteri]NMV57476.1 hypothetical protein [Limosilactobacillus reuteri]
MKKVVLVCLTALMGMTLSACGSSSSQKSTTSSNSSSKATKVVKHHKKANSEKKQSQSSTNSQQSSSQNVNGQSTNTQQSGQNSGQQQAATQSPQQSTSQSSNNGQINNAQDALNAAKAKYGDGNGNYHWTIMYDADTNQPIQNPDGSYFVKAIDPTQGTMTGTAQSVNVYPDGSMTNN